MPDQISNIIINIFSSILVGIGVWFWVTYKTNYSNWRKRKFFRIKKGQEVYITMNQNPLNPNTMSHKDIHTLIDISKIAHELEGKILFKQVNEARVAPGDQVEFCIGGTESNERTKIFLSKYLPKITMPSYDSSKSVEIKVNKLEFSYEKGIRAFAILAKIFPEGKKYPIFLICGQISISNRATAYYLLKNYSELLKKYSNRPFCQIVGIEDYKLFGYQSVKLVKDITDEVLK